MKLLLPLLCVLFAVLVCAGVAGFVYEEEIKPYVDRYANMASVLGFFVSVVGFILTVSAIFETLRVTKQAQREVQHAALEGREEARRLLDNIRIKMLEDTCDQAYSFAMEGRNAIRTGSWLRAIEKCHDARQLATRLLIFQDLLDNERAAIRAIVDEVRTTIAFMERNKLKAGAPVGLPDEKLQPIDLLLDELERIRSRFQQQLLEVPHGDVTAG